MSAFPLSRPRRRVGRRTLASRAAARKAGIEPVHHETPKDHVHLRRRQRRLALAWNAFGALDLVVAVTLGITSASGSPLQLIHAGAGSAAMQTLPWSVVPTVLVPGYLVLHAVIYTQLRRARTAGSARRAPVIRSAENSRVSTASP